MPVATQSEGIQTSPQGASAPSEWSTPPISVGQSDKARSTKWKKEEQEPRQTRLEEYWVRRRNVNNVNKVDRTGFEDGDEQQFDKRKYDR